MNDKLLAIRYIIYRVAQEFNKYHKKEANDLVYFNENNNFTLEKCLLLPYIITIANGNKNFFLEGVFENSFIPCLEENDLKVLIGNNLEDNFEIYTQESLNLQFNENGFLIFNFNPEEFVFQTDLDKEKENTLNFNINYSIKFFIERRYSNFAILDEKILKKITYQNSAFDLFKNYFSDIDVTQIELVENFNLVAIESFYFTYLNERIEEDIDVTQF